MAYTYAQMKQAIQDYTQNEETSFVSNLPNFIRQAEDLILYSVDLDNNHKNVSGNVTSGNKYLAKPTDYMSPYALAVITAQGEREFLLIKDTEYIQQVNSSGATGVPKYYAPYDGGNFILAPTPSASLAVELHYLYRPTSLADSGENGTTWLSVNAPTCLLYGSLVEAYTFMKGEQDMMMTYQNQFVNALGRLKDLAEARENTDAYRVGMPLKGRT